MAASDYALCDQCGRKVIYMGDTTLNDGTRVFCNDICVEKYAKEKEAKRAK